MLKEYQQRVVEEKKELDEKLQKLSVFLSLGNVPVDSAEKDRLLKQRNIMQEYSHILFDRIANFK